MLRLFIAEAGYVPTDLADRLQAIVPPPPEDTLASSPDLPAVVQLVRERYDYASRQDVRHMRDVLLTVRETEAEALQNLPAVLRLVDTGKVSVSDKTRRPGAAATKAVTGVLAQGDFYADEPDMDPEDAAGPILSFAWPMLLQAGNLAELSGTRLRLTKAGTKALSEPPAEVLRRLWQRWQSSTLLDEFNRIDHIKGQGGKGKRGLTAVARRRQVLESALQECPVGRWIAVEEWFRFMQADDLAFLSRYDGLQFFRLTPLGAYALGSSPTYVRPQVTVAAALTVRPDLGIEADETLSAADALLLDAWMERLAPGRWQLTLPALLAAIEGGGRLGDLHALLEAGSSKALPPAVTDLLDRAMQAAGQVQDIGAAPATRRHCQLVGDHQLVVRAASESAFRKGVRMLGIGVQTFGG